MLYLIARKIIVTHVVIVDNSDFCEREMLLKLEIWRSTCFRDDILTTPYLTLALDLDKADCHLEDQEIKLLPWKVNRQVSVHPIIHIGIKK